MTYLQVNIKYSVICILAFLVSSNCFAHPKIDTTLNDPAILNKAVSSLTHIIVEDIFNPPSASRIYAYISDHLQRL